MFTIAAVYLWLKKEIRIFVKGCYSTGGKWIYSCQPWWNLIVLCARAIGKLHLCFGKSVVNISAACSYIRLVYDTFNAICDNKRRGCWRTTFICYVKNYFYRWKNIKK